MKKFNEEELSQIFCDEGVYDENGEAIFEVVEEQQTYIDLEKGYIKNNYVVKEIATGKFFKGEGFTQTSDDFLFERNVKIQWQEVFPYAETVTRYK